MKTDELIRELRETPSRSKRKLLDEAADKLEIEISMADYQRLAMRTAGDGADIVNAALGLAGEAGEVADLVKKWSFQGHELDVPRIVEELGDVLWYIALAAEALNIDMAEIMSRNVQKLLRRYPEGFDPERSVHRG